MEHVIECEISGPLDFRSCATQEDKFPNVVRGETGVEDVAYSRNLSLGFLRKMPSDGIARYDADYYSARIYDPG